MEIGADRFFAGADSDREGDGSIGGLRGDGENAEAIGATRIRIVW